MSVLFRRIFARGFECVMSMENVHINLKFEEKSNEALYV
jgi:hypothetical protein